MYVRNRASILKPYKKYVRQAYIEKKINGIKEQC